MCMDSRKPGCTLRKSGSYSYRHRLPRVASPSCPPVALRASWQETWPNTFRSLYFAQGGRNNVYSLEGTVLHFA